MNRMINVNNNGSNLTSNSSKRAENKIFRAINSSEQRHFFKSYILASITLINKFDITTLIINL